MKISRIAKIGIFITLIILIFIWGLNFLKGKDIFKKNVDYYVVFEKVDGLNVTAPAYINGFQVGQVEDIHFAPDNSGNLIVHLIIGQEYALPINTVAQLYSEDIMGTKVINILRSDSMTFHIPGDTLLSNIEKSLREEVDAQILPIKRKAEDLIGSIDSVLTVIQSIFNEQTRRNLSESFAHIRTTIRNIESTTYTLDTLVTSEKTSLELIISNIVSITTNLKNNNDKLTTIIENFSDVSDSIARADIAGTIRIVDKSLSHFSEVMEKINTGEGTISSLVNNDTLYQNIENASLNLNRLIKDINENPKRYLHFSIFDLGKTVYEIDPEEAKKK